MTWLKFGGEGPTKVGGPKQLDWWHCPKAVPPTRVGERDAQSLSWRCRPCFSPTVTIVGSGCWECMNRVCQFQGKKMIATVLQYCLSLVSERRMISGFIWHRSILGGQRSSWTVTCTDYRLYFTPSWRFDLASSSLCTALFALGASTAEKSLSDLCGRRCWKEQKIYGYRRVRSYVAHQISSYFTLMHAGYLFKVFVHHVSTRTVPKIRNKQMKWILLKSLSRAVDALNVFFLSIFPHYPHFDLLSRYCFSPVQLWIGSSVQGSLSSYCYSVQPHAHFRYKSINKKTMKKILLPPLAISTKKRWMLHSV